MAGDLSRRDLGRVGAAIAASAALGPVRANAARKVDVVVVGGGFGGATAARYLKQFAPGLSVVLVEQNRVFHTCPFSNLVLGGLRRLSNIAHTYDRLSDRFGVEVVHQRAVALDAANRTVRLADGSDIGFEKAVLSPGVDMRWDALPGYDEAASEEMPHAWKAGTGTIRLRDQLMAMDDGGRVVMSVPAPPFRCPPGPYERASLIANYLKTHKPNSKLLILDSQDTFSKMPLFREAWETHYPDHLEWRAASQDGRVVRVDPTTLTLSTDFEDIRADVANVIPPQKAGEIASRAGVADATGWCPIDATSFESTLQSGIHVIGDATIAAPMPKSAFSANLQAKVCAIAVARLLSEMDAQPTVLANTCYSFITPDEAVSIAGVYSNTGGKFTNIDGAGGLSPVGAGADVRKAEAIQAEAWFAAITGEAFG